MPKIEIGTEKQSEARKQAGVRRPSCLVRLLFKIDGATIWIARAIANSSIDGFAGYGMAHTCYVPENQIDRRALQPSKDADRPFEQTMSELRSLAQASSLPGFVLPRSERTDD